MILAPARPATVSARSASEAAWLPPRATAPLEREPATERAPTGRMLVAQVGARMHYAVPRILAEAGALDRLCTDLCAIKDWPRLLSMLPKAVRPAVVRRLAGRVPKGLARGQVATLPGFGLRYVYRLARAKTSSDILAAQVWGGEAFSRRARDVHLTAAATSVYCFNSAGLELMQAARRRGMTTVLEQSIAPRAVGARLLRDEHDSFPGWERPLPDEGIVERLAAREAAEWEAADLILCGSDFVRDGIVACGGPAERCVVVPYGVDDAFSQPCRTGGGRALRVLTIGEVGLRKGSPYVAAAARLAGADMTFRLVGGTSLLAKGSAEIAAVAQMTGPVPRSQIHAHYAWADVFLLPSLYEGSATVIYEALAAGLPVICTPNAGSIVRDGIDGFVVPIRDPEAIVERLGRLTDPVLWSQMSFNARQRATLGQLPAYRERLLAALEPMLRRP